MNLTWLRGVIAGMSCLRNFLWKSLKHSLESIKLMGPPKKEGYKLTTILPV